jgi:hypothetical protein
MAGDKTKVMTPLKNGVVRIYRPKMEVTGWRAIKQSNVAAKNSVFRI